VIKIGVFARVGWDLCSFHHFKGRCKETGFIKHWAF